jgi:hypothetical protein
VASFDADKYHESEGNVLADLASFARVCRVWCAAARELPLSFLAEQARKQRKVKQERFHDVHCYFDNYFSFVRPKIPFGCNRPDPKSVEEIKKTMSWVNGRMRAMRVHVETLKRVEKVAKGRL